MSEVRGSTTTIKFGAGFDHPWDVESGTVEERRQQIAEAAGLELGDKTLYEIAVEASLIAHALVNAATIGAKPKAKAPAKAEPAKAAAAKPAASKSKSIAAKAKKIEPTEGMNPIEYEISKATSADDPDDEKSLVNIYKKYKDAWTPELTKLAAAKKKEIA